MKKLLSIIMLGCSLMATAQTTVNNPVIPGYHPDPSVVRVGEDYYLVNSSFQFFPGVPLFHSKDLTHWEQIGNVLNRPSQLPLDGANCALGIYAPTIRYYEGTYYMITTNVGNGGNFLVYTDDIKSGKWSDPVWLKQGGIDPSLYFERDAEGKDHCYMVSNPNDAIWLCEINPKTGEQLTESKIIWEGEGGRYPEAPHVYKIGDYFYLMIAEGGTEAGHSETIARSKTIDGPYEGCPHNPILCHQRQHSQTSPIQGTGHADLIETPDGRWYLVCLAYRTMTNNMHNNGRETFLTPVEWVDGWPVVNGNGTIPLTIAAPEDKMELSGYKGATGYFITSSACTVPGWSRRATSFGPEWMWLNNPDMSLYAMKKGLIAITPSTPTIDDDTKTCSFVSRRVEHINFEATTNIMLITKDEVQAGITLYMNGKSHYDVYLEKKEDGTHVILRYRLGNIEHVAADQVLPEKIGDKRPMFARITGDTDYYHFSYSVDGKEYLELGSMDTRYLSSETAGGFTGLVLGLYATGKENARGIFSNFVYKGLE